jgi:hypothetical protein
MAYYANEPGGCASLITDIFARRYAGTLLRTQYFEDDRRFMTQAAMMIMDPLWTGQKADTPSKATEENLKAVHDTLAIELGREFLWNRHYSHTYKWNGNETQQWHTNDYATICKLYLTKIPDDMSLGDGWVKERLSLVEVAFQRRRQALRVINSELEATLTNLRAHGTLTRLRVPGSLADAYAASVTGSNAAYEELVRDLNVRLRQADYPLTFHNGLLQFSTDQAVTAQVAQPFWALVARPEWANVDEQMKEALDRRDRSDRTAAFHAVCALESVVKIISDLKGWTHGSERGAANYVDNLCSQKNGRFIEVWEADMLKSMFSDVRNPFAHGPGQNPMPTLTAEQTDWAIDTAMSWAKSLIRRM